jgi:hypothetical protein
MRASVDTCFFFGFAVSSGLSAKTGAFSGSCGAASLGRATAGVGVLAVVVGCCATGSEEGSAAAKLKLLDGPAFAVADARVIAAIKISLRIWSPPLGEVDSVRIKQPAFRNGRQDDTFASRVSVLGNTNGKSN